MNHKTLQERLSNTPESDWIRDMKRYYAIHGHFRVEDIEKLLGDPRKGIEVASRACLEKHFVGG